jgi:hypothetical protein
MNEKRVPLNLKIKPEIVSSLSTWATDVEGRPLSNLVERILEWSVNQLQVAGNVVTLSAWEARPRSLDGESEEARIIRYRLEHEINEEVRRRISAEGQRANEGTSRGKAESRKTKANSPS